MEEIKKKQQKQITNKQTNKTKGPVPNKRLPLWYQKQISPPGAKSNHYGNINIDVPSRSELRVRISFNFRFS